MSCMLDRQKHRGPDDYGQWTDVTSRIVLGHRRLSIIDLSPGGHQPMLSADERLAIVFNGEIYNYQELRDELQALGAVFRTESDTEVLLHGYNQWGVQVLDKLVGMFAFAVWDTASQTMFLARDRAGEKPLYYAQTRDHFAFASEIHPLAGLPWVDHSIDPDAVSLYLNFQYIPAPRSIYRGICKLPPAHALLLQAGKVKIWRYWDPVTFATAPRLSLSDTEALEQLEALMRQSVKGQMIADVPLGAFLSGGIDSSLVVSLMTELSSKKVKTFTIGFEEAAFNEAHHAAAVARHLGTDHTVQYLTEKDSLDLIPSIPLMYGEPFADPSALPTHLVSRVARENVTVALSGDGGDEAFGGYTRYDLLERYEQILPWVRPVAPLIRAVSPLMPGRLKRAGVMAGVPRQDFFRGLVHYFSAAEVAALTSRTPVQPEFERAWALVPAMASRRQAMLSDLLTYLPEAMMVKVDRAAMAISLETRAPMLDHRVLEFSLQLPLAYVHGKRLLKQMVYRKVPQSLLDRPKQGFGVPLGRWFGGALKEMLLEALQPSRLEPLGIQNTRLVQQFVQEHLQGRRNHDRRLWALMVLSLWAQRIAKENPGDWR